MRTRRARGSLCAATFALAAGLALASCSTAPEASTATTGSPNPTSSSHRLLPTGAHLTVTGYDRSTPASGSTRPVTVTLTAAQSRRLVHLLDHLGAAPSGFCEEDGQLFVVNATASDGHHLWSATGDICPGTLRLVGTDADLTRTDRSCAFVNFVDGLFPSGVAGGTKGYRFVCSQH